MVKNLLKKQLKKEHLLLFVQKIVKLKKKKNLYIKTKKYKKFLSEISSKFYKLKPKNIIAVTGTNGKTSVADLFYQILKLNNIPVASIGTLGIKYKNKIIKTGLTSPDTISLHKNLQKLKKKKLIM
jgi:UDP-N-acetylmuramyl tripeptide synthase